MIFMLRVNSRSCTFLPEPAITRIKMVCIVQFSMEKTPILLCIILCLAVVPGYALAQDYLGGEIVLGGSGPNTIRVTDIPTTAAGTTAAVPAGMVSATGSVSVVTSPSDASVFVDGVRQGISPTTIPGLAPGTHTLTVKRDGYEDLSVTITIVSGQTKDYDLVLTPREPGAAATPLPPVTKTPGFGAFISIAVLGAVLLAAQKRR